jgi:Tfp pilus assembly protein PilF
MPALRLSGEPVAVVAVVVVFVFVVVVVGVGALLTFSLPNRASVLRPSATTWQGVGVACFRLGELATAEQALAEANVHDSTNPVVWAYLSLVCLQQRRPLEAEQTFRFALQKVLLSWRFYFLKDYVASAHS